MDLLIQNIGAVVSGTMKNGVIEGADAVAVADGKIMAVGKFEQMREHAYETVVDAAGQTLIPGLIDAHVHNGVEDYNACTHTAGMFEEAFYNGTTTMISEGEQGPGYPRFFGDAIGIKAETIFARRVFERFRPGGGLKLHAGALVLNEQFTERDFEELQEAGVWLVAEIGGGGLGDMEKLKPMVKLLKRYGFFISVHLAPPSIPGSTWLKASDIIELEPNKVAHVNGGTTSSNWVEIKAVIDHSEAGIELIPEGNTAKFIKTLEYLASRGELHRAVFGSDAPTGACSLPGAMNKAIVKAASLAGLTAPQALAMATGNTARLYGLNVGEIRVGGEADLVVIDAPPGCEGENALSAIEVGDLFGCSLVVSDGKILASRGRDTRATRRVCSINGTAYAPKDIHEFLYNPPMLNASL